MFDDIQKFGLKHNNLKTMLWNVTFMLRLLTLNIDGHHKRRIPIFFYIFTLTSIGCYVHVYQVSVFWFIFWRNQGEDLLEKILMFSLGISTLIGVTKFLYMYLNRGKLKKIVAAYLVCDSQVVPYSRMSRSIAMTLRGVKKRAMVFWGMIIGNAVIYILIPFITPGRHLTDDSQIIWGLEPMFESPNFEVARMITIFCVPIVVFGPVTITAFLIIIVGYTEAQMTALSQELLNLWEDAQIDYKHRMLNMNIILPIRQNHGTFVNHYVKHRLETIMTAHAINKQLIAEVEGIFKIAIAFEFSLVSIALIADLLGGLENTYLQMPFALVQVAMDCITGQRLLDANAVFEAAVYNCKWENFDVANMKLVMMILQNAQKTMKLSAGGVTWLSYTSLMSVIKSIYSAYAALRSTMN